MPTEIGRLITAMVTPFDADGQVDYQQAKRLALALLDSGTDGLVVTGTTGEGPALSMEEKARLYGEIKDAIGARGAVIAGTSDNNTGASIALSQEAEKVGADALLLTVPAYNKPPQEGLYQHFRALAESTDLPAMLYNVPSRTSLNMTSDTTVRLAEIENIIGIKEASSDPVQIAKVIRDAPDDFRVWSGNDDETFGVMSMGGYGVVSVAAHLIGGQIKHMIGLTLEGDIEAAGAEHLRLLDMFKGLFIVSNPIPVKYGLNRAGFNVGDPRLPLVPPDEHAAAQIDELLGRYDIDIAAPVG